MHRPQKLSGVPGRPEYCVNEYPIVASDGYSPNTSHPSPGIAMLAQGMNRRVRGVPNKQRDTPLSLLP
ncbi:hypothetical protein GCM10022255_059490 [Dactylosporangium darangshiense]|uniref:Uncharacterized protein n=1 Tax=Dactylosporangium darangshiense TaxID=579108 RepID=A0ABP8DFA4_9ACTN